MIPTESPTAGPSRSPSVADQGRMFLHLAVLGTRELILMETVQHVDGDGSNATEVCLAAENVVAEACNVPVTARS